LTSVRRRQQAGHDVDEKEDGTNVISQPQLQQQQHAATSTRLISHLYQLSTFTFNITVEINVKRLQFKHALTAPCID